MSASIDRNEMAHGPEAHAGEGWQRYRVAEAGADVEPRAQPAAAKGPGQIPSLGAPGVGEGFPGVLGRVWC